jgi:hypothetical protein
MDGYFNTYPLPAGTGYTLLSRSPFTDALGNAQVSNSSIYQAPSGAWVFAAGTLSWSYGLDGYIGPGADARVQGITANVLNAFVSGAPVVNRLVVTAPGTVAAGVPFVATVTAMDSWGNRATQYTGTVHLTSSDGQAVLPADYTFTASDAGSHQFSVTLNTPGSQSVTATDVLNGSVNGSQTTTVTGGASRLSISGLTSATAGTAQTATVSLTDANGNPATGYAGTVHFTSSDSQAALPADYTFTPADAGTHQFPVTLKTAGAQSVTATDTANIASTGTETVTISSGPLDHLGLSPASSTMTAGGGQAFTAGGFDQYGNSLGDVTASTAFTIAPNGSCSGNVCSATAAGAHTVTGSDAGATGAAGLSVVAAAASSLRESGLTNATAGTVQTATVTLFDAYGNLATGFAGTVHFSTSDAQAALPADYTFRAADAGTHQFAVTLKTAGSQSVTATSGAMAGSVAVRISAAAAATLTVSAPTTATSGVPIPVTVTLKDQYGNIADGYRGTVKFSTSSLAIAVIPPPYTFTSADAGSHTFEVTLVGPSVLHPTTITVTDTANPALTGSASVTVM